MKTAGRAYSHCIHGSSWINNIPMILVLLASEVSLRVFKEEGLLQLSCPSNVAEVLMLQISAGRAVQPRDKPRFSGL